MRHCFAESSYAGVCGEEGYDHCFTGSGATLESLGERAMTTVSQGQGWRWSLWVKRL
jgi:hypothetical protein